MAEQTQAVEQPEAESIDVGEKIADIFAGREPEEQPQEAAEAEETEQPTEDSEPEAETSEESDGYVEVEWDGERYSVPQSIHDALMRESDYTQKTQALSQQRSQVELQQKELMLAQEQSKFYESVQEHIDQVKMLDAYISHVQHNTDWANLGTDDAFRAKMELDNLREQKSELERTIQQKGTEFQGEIEKKRAELKAETDSTLRKSIPGWDDKARESVHEYIKTQGYPELAIGNMSVLDYQIAHKAMQFDQLKSKTSKAVKQASSTPAIKPKARNEMPKQVQEKLNYRKAVQKAKSPHEAEQLAKNRIGQIFGG